MWPKYQFIFFNDSSYAIRLATKNFKWIISLLNIRNFLRIKYCLKLFISTRILIRWHDIPWETFYPKWSFLLNIFLKHLVGIFCLLKSLFFHAKKLILSCQKAYSFMLKRLFFYALIIKLNFLHDSLFYKGVWLKEV